MSFKLEIVFIAIAIVIAGIFVVAGVAYDDSVAQIETITASGGSVELSETDTDKININTASKKQLETLDGIGEGIAKKIIEYRKNTPFEKIEDILNVNGIGQKKYLEIVNDIEV